jgi:hypothetical protein
MSRRLATVLAAIAVLCVAIPTAATAKPKRHPVSVDVEFSFTGLAEFKQDTEGTTLTCPDSSEPYRYDDHIRAHIAFDTVFQVRINLKPHRRKRVFESKEQHFGGSTWSISGDGVSDDECTPPQPYSCSGTFKAGAPAPIFFAPVKGERWLALMHGLGGIVSDPAGCDYQGIHRHILNDVPDEVIDRAVGGFNFKTETLLKRRDKTVTGDFDYRDIPSDCGSDDTSTCTQSAEGSGGVRYHRLKINYAR